MLPSAAQDPAAYYPPCRCSFYWDFCNLTPAESQDVAALLNLRLRLRGVLVQDFEMLCVSLESKKAA